MPKKKVIVDEENVADADVTHHVFIKDGRKHYPPQYLTVGETTLRLIFPIPLPNAVGAIDGDSNGIVSLKFGGYGKDPEREPVVTHFSDVVYGAFNYALCPNFSQDLIAYCKTRLAVIANVKTGEAFHVSCGLPMGDHLTAIRFMDTQNDTFAIVKSIYDGKGSWDDHLHVVKLCKKEFIDTGRSMKLGAARPASSDLPPYNAPHVFDNKLFVYEKEFHKMLCTDGSAIITHPFSDTFDRHSKRVGTVVDFALHPKSPFGVVIERCGDNVLDNDLVVIRYDITDPKKEDGCVTVYAREFETLAAALGLERMALAYHGFSPCGKWYAAGCVDPARPKDPRFIAIPVNYKPERGGILDMDDIVILGQVKNITSMAWTQEPTSLVVSNGEILHKWDMEELPNARVFKTPDGGGAGKRRGIFSRLFGRSK